MTVYHWPGDITLSALIIYPIKSAGGIFLQQSLLEIRGLEYDRRWMVVKGNGTLATQREFPEMSLIRVSLLPATDPEHVLQVEAPGMPLLLVPRRSEGPVIQTRVWEDNTAGVVVSSTASAWFSHFLTPGCELLYMPGTAERAQRNKPFSSLLSFADGNPFHLVNEASVADLNTRLSRQVDVQTFRPNLVVRGAAPYAEDHWRRISIGPLEFLVVESTARCSVLNVSQDAQTGAVQTSAEPLRTLARTRRRGQSVIFGQNMLQGSALFSPGSRLEVGWPVTVLESADVANPTY